MSGNLGLCHFAHALNSGRPYATRPFDRRGDLPQPRQDAGPAEPPRGVDDRRYHDRDCVPRDNDPRLVEQIWVTWVRLRQSANPVNLL